MNTLIARKVGMTQIYDENSKALGVTVLDVSDCRVVQVKNNDIDGYSAAQLTIGSKKNSTKPLKNHFKKYNSEPGEIVFEVEIDDSFEISPGSIVKVSDIFEVGQKVDISGLSKGKGFAGVMKRHGFGGGRASHGKNSVMRKPGSVGAGADPSRIWKGKKMPGRYGGYNVTCKNLEILKIDLENNLLFIKGAVPGANNGLVTIYR